MGGTSKGRVRKTRTPKPISSSSSRATQPTPRPSMRRGLSRRTRSSASPHTNLDLSAIDGLFNQFKDPDGNVFHSPPEYTPTPSVWIHETSIQCSDQDKIGPEGLQALFDAMEVDPLDIVSLVFAWKLMAKVPFEFSRTEFVKGCTAMEVDSLEKLKAVLPTLKKSLDNEKDFRSFYMFAFDYNKPPEQRSLPIETARQLFPLILEGRFAHLDLWNEFLEDRKQAISKDTYSLLLDFSKTIDYNLDNFDEENGAWPVLLDEFVDFAKPRIAANKDKMDE